MPIPSSKSPEPHPQVLLVDFGGGEHGHRGQYNAMLERLFPIRRAPFNLAAVLSREPILAPQIEHAPAAFALLCLVRAVLGRRTAGFLLRPLPALQGTTLRLRMKRLTLKVLRRTPGVQVLTIIPFQIEPGFDRIAHGWIYDLQNWDMALDPANSPGSEAGAVANAIVAAKAGRKVCCAIGRQDSSKGFDAFARLYCGNEQVRKSLLFAFGGKVDPRLEADSQALVDAGGFALNRFVSDDELRGLYDAADLVWCAYDPNYDQASGILGRAMQLGIPVVARPGSIVARICEMEGHPWVADSADQDWCCICEGLTGVDPAHARSRARRHGAVSLARLSEALGVASNPIEALA